MYFFITNRDIVKGEGGVDSLKEDGLESAGDNLRFGQYVPENLSERTGEFELYPEPKDEIQYGSESDASSNSELSGSSRLFKELYDSMLDGAPTKQDTLFFIHGFNTDLDGLRDNFYELHKRYVEPEDSPIKNILAFTWPGRSPLIPAHYHDDKKDAIRSGEALGRAMIKGVEFLSKFLRRIENTPCNGRIHLMLHSMGHRVFKHAMLEINSSRMPRKQLFEEILCIAGDIEYDIFEEENAFYNLIDFGERVHIYYHKRDRILKLSDNLKLQGNRLGEHGRRYSMKENQSVIDCDVSQTKDDDDYKSYRDFGNHWYYYTSSSVVADIKTVLSGGNSIYSDDAI